VRRSDGFARDHDEIVDTSFEAESGQNMSREILGIHHITPIAEDADYHWLINKTRASYPDSDLCDCETGLSETGTGPADLS